MHHRHSLAVSIYFSIGLLMHPPQIFYLTGGAIVLACLQKCVPFGDPRARNRTFGHLQTLVDLIDEWPEKDQKLYWGRKEAIEGDGTIANEETLELLPVSLA
jgi:hypothetical protein